MEDSDRSIPAKSHSQASSDNSKSASLTAGCPAAVFDRYIVPCGLLRDLLPAKLVARLYLDFHELAPIANVEVDRAVPELGAVAFVINLLDIVDCH